MEKYLTEHWILSILVTILLGAIGSGLWETVFKRIVFRISNALFTILSFGAKRARDNVYKEAARGYHELPSLNILLIIFISMPTFLITLEFTLYSKVYLQKPSISVLTEECNKKDGNEKIDCVREIIKNEIGYKLHWLVLVTILITINILFRFISINRSNLAITYYKQCLKICRPLLNEIVFLETEQKFSLVETKEEYFEIIKYFNEIAENNSLNLPKLYIK